LSSILRALKKVESDPRHQAKTGPLDSKFVPLADTSPQKTPAGIIMMVIGGGLVCGVVILAGWWFFAEKNRLPAVAPQALPRQILPETEMAPVAPREAASPGPSAPLANRQAEPAADILAPPKSAAQIPGAKPVILEPSPPVIEPKATMPVDGSAAESALPAPAIPRPEITAKAPAEKGAVPVTEPPEVATKVKPIAIPVLNDPEMKLQAITWSKEPLKRIVVINNRILRQGETVSGYRIDTINQDDVELSNGGEKWQLVFRIK
jgi:hypothetical protein